jgi:hypothetical protein
LSFENRTILSLENRTILSFEMDQNRSLVLGKAFKRDVFVDLFIKMIIAE